MVKNKNVFGETSGSYGYGIEKAIPRISDIMSQWVKRLGGVDDFLEEFGLKYEDFHNGFREKRDPNGFMKLLNDEVIIGTNLVKLFRDFVPRDLCPEARGPSGNRLGLTFSRLAYNLQVAAHTRRQEGKGYIPFLDIDNARSLSLKKKAAKNVKLNQSHRRTLLPDEIVLKANYRVLLNEAFDRILEKALVIKPDITKEQLIKQVSDNLGMHRWQMFQYVPLGVYKQVYAQEETINEIADNIFTDASENIHIAQKKAEFIDIAKNVFRLPKVMEMEKVGIETQDFKLQEFFKFYRPHKKIFRHDSDSANKDIYDVNSSWKFVKNLKKFKLDKKDPHLFSMLVQKYRENNVSIIKDKYSEDSVCSILKQIRELNEKDGRSFSALCNINHNTYLGLESEHALIYKFLDNIKSGLTKLGKKTGETAMSPENHDLFEKLKTASEKQVKKKKSLIHKRPQKYTEAVKDERISEQNGPSF